MEINPTPNDFKDPIIMIMLNILSNIIFSYIMNTYFMIPSVKQQIWLFHYSLGLLLFAKL